MFCAPHTSMHMHTHALTHTHTHTQGTIVHGVRFGERTSPRVYLHARTHASNEDAYCMQAGAEESAACTCICFSPFSNMHFLAGFGSGEVWGVAISHGKIIPFSSLFFFLSRKPLRLAPLLACMHPHIRTHTRAYMFTVAHLSFTSVCDRLHCSRATRARRWCGGAPDAAASRTSSGP
jgi:hypothetical protein